MNRLAIATLLALSLAGVASAQDAEDRDQSAALKELRQENAKLRMMLTGLSERVSSLEKASAKIGVVDLGVLFKHYKRKDALEEEINRDRESMKAALQQDAELVREERRRLDRLPEDERPLAAEQIKKAQYDMELKKERYQKELKTKVERHTLLILSELEATVRKYGKAYGYTLIFKVDSGGRGAGEGLSLENFQEQIFRAQISDVLYRNTKAVDVTEKVERLLNSPANLRQMEREASKRKKRVKPGKPSKGF